MINYESWKEINPETCSKCKFGSKSYSGIGKANCFYPHPKTKFLEDTKGWVCREFEVNK